MAQFPRLYSQIAALGQKVLGGLQRHPEMFPSCDSEAISQALEDFYQACSDLNTADAQVKAAANTKKDTLGRLSQIIKNQVRRAQADTSSSPAGESLYGPETKLHRCRRKQKRLAACRRYIRYKP